MGRRGIETRFFDFLFQFFQQLFKNSLETFGVLMAGIHFCLEHTGVIFEPPGFPSFVKDALEFLELGCIQVVVFSSLRFSLKNGDCYTHFAVRIKRQLKVLQEEFLVDVDGAIDVGNAQGYDFFFFFDIESHFSANIRELFQIHHSFISYFLGDILAVYYIQTRTVVPMNQQRRRIIYAPPIVIMSISANGIICDVRPVFS